MSHCLPSIVATSLIKENGCLFLAVMVAREFDNDSEIIPPPRYREDVQRVDLQRLLSWRFLSFSSIIQPLHRHLYESIQRIRMMSIAEALVSVFGIVIRHGFERLLFLWMSIEIHSHGRSGYQFPVLFIG